MYGKMGKCTFIPLTMQIHPVEKKRHCCAEYLYFNENGTIQEIERTDAGIGIFPKLRKDEGEN